jgi:fucose 4-O-acetylase-like acetyltransferase
MTTARLDYADAFKFLAMVGVICAHLPQGGRFDAAAWAIVHSVQAATGWCVLAFFVVSGALFRSGLARPIGLETSKRALRLLVPWLAFSLFYKIAVSVLTEVGLIANAQPIPSGGRDLWIWLLQPADPQLYFLVYLFLMQVLLLLLNRVGNYVPVFLGAASFIGWWALFLPQWGSRLLHGASIELVPLYFAFLTFGMFCGTSLKRITIMCAFASGAALLIVVIWGYVLIAWQLAAPWVLLLALRASEGCWVVKPLAYLGRFSGGVYVWHAPLVIAAVSIVSVALLGSGFIGVLVTVLLCFCCSAVLGVLVNRSPRLRWLHI